MVFVGANYYIGMVGGGVLVFWCWGNQGGCEHYHLVVNCAFQLADIIGYLRAGNSKCLPCGCSLELVRYV